MYSNISMLEVFIISYSKNRREKPETIISFTISKAGNHSNKRIKERKEKIPPIFTRISNEKPHKHLTFKMLNHNYDKMGFLAINQFQITIGI